VGAEVDQLQLVAVPACDEHAPGGLVDGCLPYSLWAPWERSAMYLALGVLTLLAGVLVRVRENRAVPGVPG